jgi:hypothetical protein
MKGHIPFLLDVHQSQIDRLLGRHIIGKLDLGLDVLPDPSIDIFDGIGIHALSANRPRYPCLLYQ